VELRGELGDFWGEGNTAPNAMEIIKNFCNAIKYISSFLLKHLLKQI
jgi:hypothetical protein